MSQWEQLRSDAHTIIQEAIQAVQPDAAVRRALLSAHLTEKLYLVAAGKAAWQMSKTAQEVLGSQVIGGHVITKYGHSRGPIPGLKIWEAGHPIPDENGVQATRAVLEGIRSLPTQTHILFLLSGGGSALFELPLIPLEELQDINRQLLASGADITQMNVIRKRLSAVKGGRFAEACEGRAIFSIILSDILGDPLDRIASGPACADPSTCAQAWEIVRQYGLQLSRQAQDCLSRETPKEVHNVTSCITGSVRELCAAAEKSCRRLGYDTLFLTDCLSCQAREAGAFLGAIGRTHAGRGKLAYLAGGETVVRLFGDGKGGRNQELALAAAPLLAGTCCALFSLGSDGTDGPTDAAGGYVDGESLAHLTAAGLKVEEVLNRNDAYHALEAIGGLIRTGPTGTNVNDISVLLILPDGPSDFSEQNKFIK